MSNYPTLRLGVLQGIAGLKASCDAHPGYLRRHDCPYDEDTVELLEALFKPREIEIIKEVHVEKPEAKKRGRPSNSKELSEDDAIEVENEAKELLKELRMLDKTLEGEIKQLDTTTKLQIYKTRAGLLEKLVSIRERFTSARKVEEFKQTVVGILDDLIPEEKRDEFLARLEPYL